VVALPLAGFRVAATGPSADDAEGLDAVDAKGALGAGLGAVGAQVPHRAVRLQDEGANAAGFACAVPACVVVDVQGVSSLDALPQDGDQVGGECESVGRWFGWCDNRRLRWFGWRCCGGGLADGAEAGF
jgi:hypothetical protein